MELLELELAEIRRLAGLALETLDEADLQDIHKEIIQRAATGIWRCHIGGRSDQV